MLQLALAYPIGSLCLGLSVRLRFFRSSWNTYCKSPSLRNNRGVANSAGHMPLCLVMLCNAQSAIWPTWTEPFLVPRSVPMIRVDLLGGTYTICTIYYCQSMRNMSVAARSDRMSRIRLLKWDLLFWTFGHSTLKLFDLGVSGWCGQIVWLTRPVNETNKVPQARSGSHMKDKCYNLSALCTVLLNPNSLYFVYFCYAFCLLFLNLFVNLFCYIEVQHSLPVRSSGLGLLLLGIASDSLGLLFVGMAVWAPCSQCWNSVMALLESVWNITMTK